MKNKHALHVYYGDGKGKTTACVGLSVRASGRGLKVLFSQFMKTNTSGELKNLKLLPGVEFVPGLPIEKFTSRMTIEELAEEKKRQYENFARLCEKIEAQRPQMIVLDEILVAEHMGFIAAEEICEKADAWLEFAEVVFSGHWCCEPLRQKADYVTHLVKEKHPFDEGVNARIGVEF